MHCRDGRVRHLSILSFLIKVKFENEQLKYSKIIYNSDRKKNSNVH